MAVISLYPELLQAVSSPGPVWQRLSPRQTHFLRSLEETYGPEVLGGQGVGPALEQAAPALRMALAPAPAYGMEGYAERLLAQAAPLLPGRQPDLYLSTLLFMAPAATLSLSGRPVLALGLERFHPAPPAGGPKTWYHPREAEEMVPHEAAHAARMQTLGLPPTPRRLSLLDMVMLEGTALTFTDLLLGRQTLATFMPPERLAWHRAHDTEVRRAISPDLGATGMSPFLRYFSAESPVSGYYVGYSLCREYLNRYGPASVTELIGLPSAEILRRLH